jgi:hypothetical protein
VIMQESLAKFCNEQVQRRDGSLWYSSPLWAPFSGSYNIKTARSHKVNK